MKDCITEIFPYVISVQAGTHVFLLVIKQKRDYNAFVFVLCGFMKKEKANEKAINSCIGNSSFIVS